VVDKIQLIEAIQENRLTDFIARELKNKTSIQVYDYELSKQPAQRIKLTKTVSKSYHHNDIVIAEGTVDFCTKALAIELKM
jgi:hypothetical protein